MFSQLCRNIALFFALFFIVTGNIYAAPPPAESYYFDFQGLDIGQTFTETSQPYADVDGYGRGIVIEGGINSLPTVVQESIGTNRVLKNPGTDEFLNSAHQMVYIKLQNFFAEIVDLNVGVLDSIGNPITAYMLVRNQGSIVAIESVDLGDGPTGVHHILRVEPGEAFDEVIVTYGITGTGSISNAMIAEAIDDIYFKVSPGDPPPPPVDTTPPEVHILQPTNTETVDDGWITGYVVEDMALESVHIENITNGAGAFVATSFDIVDGEPRYFFYYRLPLDDGLNALSVTAEDGGGNTDSETVSVFYVAPEFYPPPPTWPPELDFRASSIEVTQAIQRWTKIYNAPGTQAQFEDTLPAGKRTLVRVYPEVLGTVDPIPDVNCTLYGYDSLNNPLPDSPIRPEGLVTVHPGDTWETERDERNKSCNFILPEEWTHGNVRLEAIVNEWNAIPEIHYDALNNAIAELTFVETEQLCLHTFQMHSINQGGVTPTWQEVNDNLFYLRHFYPVNPDNLVVYQGGVLDTTLDLDTGDSDTNFSNLVDMAHLVGRQTPAYWGTATMANCDFNTHLGLTDDTVTHRGVTTHSPLASMSVADGASNFYRIKTAHEVGHAQGLGHVDSYEPDCSGVDSDGVHEPKPPYEPYPDYLDPDGIPYFEGSIGDFGVRINDDNSLRLWDPSTTGDFMSYCDTRWLSNYSFDWFMERFGGYSLSVDEEFSVVPSAITAPYFIVSGRINFDSFNEYATVDPVWQRILPAGSNDHVGTGVYRIELLDENNNVLFTRYFDPSPAFGLEKYATYYELIPAKLGTQKIRLLGGNILKVPMQAAGTNPPVVQVLYPNGGEKLPAGGPVQVSWTAKDPDDDDMTYALFYSRDDGVTWHVIATDLVNTSHTIDAQLLPSCLLDCRIKVVASDGINVGEDQSDTAFRKAGSIPTATIVSPGDGTMFDFGESIFFEGVATDQEDVSIAQNNIVWSSNRSGEIGRGTMVSTSGLESGIHTITLSVRDSSANVAEDEIYVVVNNRCNSGYDSDRDGFVDMCDNCMYVSNQDQLDSDDDGYGNRCDADLDQSGFVNIKDLAEFKKVFGTKDPHADFDSSGFVNIKDLAILKSLFGKPPGPSGLVP